MAADSSVAVEEGVRPVVGHRIWLHRGEGPALGMGAFRLLVLVDSTGSLSRAATEMGMAYSKAWQSIRQAEAAVGFQLIERRAGGRGGGGSSLSPKGRWLVAAFSALQDEATETIRLLGEKHLRDWPARAGEAAPSTPAGPLGKVRLGGA